MSVDSPAHSIALTAAVSAQLLAKLKAILEGVEQIQTDVKSITAVLKSHDMLSLEQNASQETDLKLQNNISKDDATLQSTNSENGSKSARTKKLKRSTRKSTSQASASSKNFEDDADGTSEVLFKKSKHDNSNKVDENLSFSFKLDNDSVSEVADNHPTPFNRPEATVQPKQEFLESLFSQPNSPVSGLFSSPILPKEEENVSASGANRRGRKRKR